MQPENSPVDNTQIINKQSIVTYYSGVTVFSGGSTLLQQTNDRIKLVEVDQNNK